MTDTYLEESGGREMKSLIFSTPMIKAILAGKKNMTRRPLKRQPESKTVKFEYGNLVEYQMIGSCWNEVARHKPTYQPGDVLYVRETWASCILDGKTEYLYKAHPMFDSSEPGDIDWTWRSPRFMPQSAARIFLKVTGLRVERLNDISEEDARREGITDGGCLNCGESEPCGCINPAPDPRQSFIRLWNGLYTKKPEYQWDKNCWVWVITFERTEKP